MASVGSIPRALALLRIEHIARVRIERENGVVDILLLREIDVEFDVRVRAPRQEEEAERIAPRSLEPRGLVDLLGDLFARDEVTGALARLEQLAVFVNEHELVRSASNESLPSPSASSALRTRGT